MVSAFCGKQLSVRTLEAMPCCLLSDTLLRFPFRNMDDNDDTFAKISREYYGILHDIDNLCQTLPSQGKSVTNTQQATEPCRRGRPICFGRLRLLLSVVLCLVGLSLFLV